MKDYQQNKNKEINVTERNRDRRGRERQEGVYLQGRGGGIPRSAKSGSEKRRAEETFIFNT